MTEGAIPTETMSEETEPLPVGFVQPVRLGNVQAAVAGTWLPKDDDGSDGEEP